MSETHRTCNKCHVRKSLAEFPLKLKGKGKHIEKSLKCQSCRDVQKLNYKRQEECRKVLINENKKLAEQGEEPKFNVSRPEPKKVYYKPEIKYPEPDNYKPDIRCSKCGKLQFESNMNRYPLGKLMTSCKDCYTPKRKPEFL